MARDRGLVSEKEQLKALIRDAAKDAPTMSEFVRRLQANARLIAGNGKRAEGVGSPSGRGYFLAPTLLRASDAGAAPVVHEHEVFAPVATLLPYDGSPGEAARLVALGGGMLVTSVYSDDADWLAQFVARGAATSGRLYIGSRESAAGAWERGARRAADSAKRNQNEPAGRPIRAGSGPAGLSGSAYA